MKLSHLTAFEKHLSSSDGILLPSVYLIIGKDHVEAMVAAKGVIAKAEREVTWLQGDKLTPEALSQDVDSFSMFSPKRLIAIDKANALKQPAKDHLLSFLSNPGEPMLLLVAESFSAQMKLYKKIEKVGVVLNLDDGKPWEKEEKRVQWVLSKAKAEGKHLDVSAAKAFVKRVGTEYSTLATEFEKLLCYLGEESIIGQEAIEAICLRTEQETVWKLGDAIFARNLPSARNALSSLFHSGTPGILILRGLRKQVSGTLAGDAFNRKNQKYGIPALQKALIAIDDAELQTKNSALSEELILELLLAKLVKK